MLGIFDRTYGRINKIRIEVLGSSGSPFYPVNRVNPVHFSKCDLVVVGMDPRRSRDTWYLYHYFEGTYAADLRRFPTAGILVDWMAEEGFERVEWRPAERIFAPLTGRDVLKDPFLHKDSTSQLALLSDAAYAAGVQRIELALAQAEAAGQTLVFPVDILLAIIVGRLPAGEG